MRVVVRLIGLVLILQGLIACGSEEILDSADPANLQVELNIADDGSGKVEILATADNTVEYEFRLGNNPEPEERNTTGLFEYTFEISGNYEVEVRAVGASGRYLRSVIMFTIELASDNVTVDQGYTTPMHYDGWNLLWNDEFEGNAVNSDYWVFETGDGCPNLCGWGNNEWQYYRSQNAWVEDGVLTIEARRESVGNRNYTSARMKTQGKKSFQYGRIDIRALLPKGQGIWPALWMLGENITSVGWPACGEIDIMEMIGGSGRENQVHGTVHWDLDGQHVQAGGSYTLSSGTFADEYHVFSIIWNENLIRWFVNDIQYYQIDISPNHMTEFHEEHFFLFNVAVGGNWPGYPDATTVFPQQMKVDYIRVFQLADQ
ncbi:MAG: glycoside hydrolase family 16 protein [Bacteroidetes bacterium]|nr:MAG: glycoside hydrolase family 16 protein [Bacteroidota bacterium]